MKNLRDADTHPGDKNRLYYVRFMRPLPSGIAARVVDMTPNLFISTGVWPMKSNRHNVSLPDEVLAQISQKIGEIEALFSPHAHTLTPKERQNLLKMGDKSLAFVKKANEYAKTVPALVPAYVDVQEFDTDLADTERLFAVSRRLDILARQMDDTIFLASSEAFEHALAIYESAKGAAARNVPGAKIAAQELKARFPGRGRETTDPEPPQA